jgi:ketosteroid isomerase-like protein
MAEPAVADELAIRRTMAAYCQHLDDGEFEALAALFTPEGSFDYAGQGAAGRAAIAAWFAERNPQRRGKHLTMNVVIAVDGDRASASSDFLYLSVGNGAITPSITGRYDDRFTRAEGRWLIERRTVAPFTGADAS